MIVFTKREAVQELGYTKSIHGYSKKELVKLWTWQLQNILNYLIRSSNEDRYQVVSADGL